MGEMDILCKYTIYLNSRGIRPDRDRLHMASAVMWSLRSVCKRAKHGCIITNYPKNKVLAFGYNGPARGLDNDRCRKTEGNCGCLHAEMNAIAGCESFNEPKVAFITAAPCELCAQLLVQANVREVQYIVDYRDKTGINLLYSLDQTRMIVLQVEPIELSIECLSSKDLSSPST